MSKSFGLHPSISFYKFLMFAFKLLSKLFKNNFKGTVNGIPISDGTSKSFFPFLFAI